MGRKEDNIKKAQTLMRETEFIRNIGTAAHIDHGKTTLSDNLIAGAGMMSEELAGKQLLLDYDEQEQARGITINAANASMVHEFRGKEYLINLIDTPGHVDFGGDVTRAMRAIDGVIIVVCAVEGVMPQTETVIRQALKEKVKPVLFVNKVDRLINELKVDPKEMENRFFKIITEVNERIKKLAPDDLEEDWIANVEDGSVAFGSAYYNWAISVPFMKETGITFKDIYDYLAIEDQKALAQKAPIHRIILDIAVDHCPNPLDAQKLRIPQIWHGDLESPLGRSMLECDSKGDVALMVTKIIMDPHAGEVAVGRLFSGTVVKGQELQVIGMPNPNRVQQIALSVGADRIPVDEIIAGNIVAASGVKDAVAGSTVSSNAGMESFERIVHYSEPVVTVAIEAKHMKDLPKLVEVLRTVSKADPSIQVEINQETGEHLMSGMGELHLEITEYRIVNEYGVEITSSEPIVVYRESIEGKGGPFEGKSPNKHNRFYIEVEPLEEDIVSAILSGEIQSEGKVKDAKKLARELQDMGMAKVEAKGVESILGANMFVDVTKGIQYLHETIELCVQAFQEAMELGPLAQEKCMGMKVKLVDAKLHEDAIHRGPAQVIPATRRAIREAMVQGGAFILEPKQIIRIDVPTEQLSGATKEVNNRRGKILEMSEERGVTSIKTKLPVAEMFGFNSALKSATGGLGFYWLIDVLYEPLPKDLERKVISQIKQRKGIVEEEEGE